MPRLFGEHHGHALLKAVVGCAGYVQVHGEVARLGAHTGPHDGTVVHLTGLQVARQHRVHFDIRDPAIICMLTVETKVYIYKVLFFGASGYKRILHKTCFLNSEQIAEFQDLNHT